MYYMSVSLNGGIPNLHPKCWSFLGRNTNGCWVHFRKPPYTCIYLLHGCFRKWWVFPPNHPLKNRDFHHKSSIFGVFPLFLEFHPHKYCTWKFAHFCATSSSASKGKGWSVKSVTSPGEHEDSPLIFLDLWELTHTIHGRLHIYLHLPSKPT